MIVLGLDTCLDACSAAVIDGETVLAARSEPMARGHQERLAPMVRELMSEAGLAFDRLDRVGVTVGPGSFTGLRVGLSFAKGLGAALSVPVIGVGALEALAAGRPGTVFSVLNAKRDQVYLQAFADGVATMAPDALTLDVAAARLAELARGAVTLAGSGAPLLADMLPGADLAPDAAIDPVQVARLAAAKPVTPPRPLYLRAPDAKLPGGRAGPAGMKLRGAWPHEADDLARLHGLAFDHPWTAAELRGLIEGPGGFALLVEDKAPLGFILCRSGGGEAEILTLAVDPAARRRGFAKALVQASAGAAQIAGAESLFLEVAVDNAPAIALYRATGFAEAGLRRGYYDRGGGNRVDALVMRLDLGRAPS